VPLPAQWSAGGPCASRCANASSLRTPYFVRASGISGACFTAIRERQFPDLGVVRHLHFKTRSPVSTRCHRHHQNKLSALFLCAKEAKNQRLRLGADVKDAFAHPHDWGESGRSLTHAALSKRVGS
jgi:hypothetical protein